MSKRYRQGDVPRIPLREKYCFLPEIGRESTEAWFGTFCTIRKARTVRDAKAEPIPQGGSIAVDRELRELGHTWTLPVRRRY